MMGLRRHGNRIGHIVFLERKMDSRFNYKGPIKIIIVKAMIFRPK